MLATFLRAQAGNEPTASNPAVEAAVVFRNCLRDFFLMAASPEPAEGNRFSDRENPLFRWHRFSPISEQAFSQRAYV